MKRLPLHKQITFGAIVGGTAFATSFALALLASAEGDGQRAAPSPLIGLSLGVVAGGIYLALAGNRRVPLADKAAREAALASVAADRARLLVYRRGFVGKLAGVDVRVDGEVRTQLKSPRFAAIDLAPGIHGVETEVQNKRSERLELSLAAGETAAIEIVMSLGKSRMVRQDDVVGVQRSLASIPMVAA